MNGLPHISKRSQRLLLQTQSLHSRIGESIELINPWDLVNRRKGFSNRFWGVVKKITNATKYNPVKTYSLWFDDKTGTNHTSGKIYEIHPSDISKNDFCMDEGESFLVHEKDFFEEI